MRRYLLLDDNVAFAENLAEILRDAGDDATVVTDGARAVSLAGTLRYDALLTDMKMPGMTGAQVVHHLRRVDPGLAMVVITAYPGERELETARKEGLLAVLPKPVPIAPLMGLLARARRDGVVLLLEDDPSQGDSLSEELRARGFSSITARSAREVEHLSEVRPFAAVVEPRPPGGPEGDALRLLRTRLPRLPVFVWSTPPDEDRARALVCDPIVISAPAGTPALLDALERAHDSR